MCDRNNITTGLGYNTTTFPRPNKYRIPVTAYSARVPHSVGRSGGSVLVFGVVVFFVHMLGVGRPVTVRSGSVVMIGVGLSRLTVTS